MRRLLLLTILFSAFSCTRVTEPTQVRYKPEWQSLSQKEVPEWVYNDKLGISLQFGLYCIPSFPAADYPQNMYLKGHPVNEYHELRYGPVDEFGYKNFIPMFKAGKFDANTWAELIKNSGAKVGGMVAEHSDGFSMWDSELTRFDSYDMGPQRDILGEMKQALDQKGLKFLTSFHHHKRFGNYPTWDKSTGTAEPAYADFYGPILSTRKYLETEFCLQQQFYQEFCGIWASKIEEVIEQYEPDFIFLDDKLRIIEEEKLLEVFSYFYNSGLRSKKDVVIAVHQNELVEGSGIKDMTGTRVDEIQHLPWVTSTFLHHPPEDPAELTSYRPADNLIRELADVVSKNGFLLLKVSPASDGLVPCGVSDVLSHLGDWLSRNGEAIYDTRPWIIHGEGETYSLADGSDIMGFQDKNEPVFRFTTKQNTLYAILLSDSNQDPVTIRSFNPQNGINNSNIGKVSLLETGKELSWAVTEEGLQIFTGEPTESQASILTFKIERMY